jgi:CDP-diacylglycerol---serine O-phosphatidyltransferase
MRPRKKKRPRNRKKKGIYLLPNLFTSASLFGGFYSIISAIQGAFTLAATAILISCVFDALDGRIARFTRSSSRFGSEYDSLSDLVAFGVAPGILAFLWALKPFGRLGWMASFMYVVCGALRLARFNVQKDTVEMNYFKGLPIPGAASLIASFVLFAAAVGGFPSGSKHIFIILLIYALSFLMVSTIDYPSFKGLEYKRRKSFNLLVSIILIALVIAYKPKVMLFFVLAAYTLSGPIITAYRLRARRAAKKTAADETRAAAPKDLEHEEERRVSRQNP